MQSSLRPASVSEVCRSTLLNSNPEGNRMYVRELFCLFLLAGAGMGWAGPTGSDPQIDTSRLKPAASFSAIQDESQRSVALFTQPAPVIAGPRCRTCQPVRRQPTRG